MTYKQMINVSDCNYHNNGKCTNSSIGQCNCTNVVSCYYKEYKHKEQECEAYKMEAEEGKEIYAELKAENEKLKQILEDIKSLCYQQDLNEDFFACEVLQKINEVENV